MIDLGAITKVMQKSQVLDMRYYTFIYTQYYLVLSSTPFRIYILSRCTSPRISRDTLLQELICGSLLSMEKTFGF